MDRSSILSLSDRQLRLIQTAARVVPVERRDLFLQNVAKHLTSEPTDDYITNAYKQPQLVRDKDTRAGESGLVDHDEPTHFSRPRITDGAGNCDEFAFSRPGKCPIDSYWVTAPDYFPTFEIFAQNAKRSHM